MSDEELEKFKEKKTRELLKNVLSKGPSDSMDANVLEANERNFNRILTENARLVVDFWAHWCMPCKMIEPIIYELAEAYAGRVRFARLNVDSNPEIAARFDVMSIPTLIMFENAVEIDRIVGALPKEFIERRIMKAFRF